MSIKRIFYLSIVLIHYCGFAQYNINDYKYVVVPYQYNFLNENDKFRANTLLRHLFNENGFTAYFDKEDLPKDLFDNRCLAMYADVEQISAGFKTEIKINIKDCDGNVILETLPAKTKEKDLAKAYNIVIRDAFDTIKFLGYSYNGTSKSQNTTNGTSKASNGVNEELEIDMMKKEVDSLKPLQSQESVSSSANSANVLYAQPIEGGYQLIDLEPKKVMVLLTTDTKNVFKVEGKQAIVFKKGDRWIYAETLNSQTKEKELNIKF